MKEMTIREVQMVCLEILKDVHDFCLKNDIKYSLCGGTLIGAIRHNGFIPWDDDVDIVMPRPEYDRFIHTYQSQKGYKLFSHEIKGGKNVRIRLTKVCDMQKTIMDKGAYVWTNEDTGIGIDIIPADGAPMTLDEAQKHIASLAKYAGIVDRYRTKYASFSCINRYKTPIAKLKFVIRKVRGYFIDRNCVMKFIDIQKQYDYQSSSFFCAGYVYGVGEWLPKCILEEFELHKFENTVFFITKQYDNYLKRVFGNYMVLPPENKRTSHDIYRYYWKD